MYNVCYIYVGFVFFLIELPVKGTVCFGSISICCFFLFLNLQMMGLFCPPLYLVLGNPHPSRVIPKYGRFGWGFYVLTLWCKGICAVIPVVCNLPSTGGAAMGCFCLCVLVQAPSLSCKLAVIASMSVLFLSRPSLLFSPKRFFFPRAFSLQALGGQSSLDHSAYKDAVSSLPLSGCSSHAPSCQAPCLLQKRSIPKEEPLSTTAQRALRDYTKL